MIPFAGPALAFISFTRYIKKKPIKINASQ